MDYSIQTSVTGEFDNFVDTTIAALEDEEFGVLCDIDIQATLKEKLGEEFRQYRILGACNPPLAHDGLTEEIELGAAIVETKTETTGPYTETWTVMRNPEGNGFCVQSPPKR